MESSEIVDINVETEKEEKYMLEVKNKISYKDLKKIIKEEIIHHFDFEIQYKDKIYSNSDNNEKFNFEKGDIIYTILTISKESFEINADFHKNLNLDEADKTITEITGLLQLLLFRYIARNIENEKNIEKIKNSEIQNIILDLKEGIQFKNDTKENIKAQLKETKGNNILSYSNYISSLKIKKEQIENLIDQLFNKNKKSEIINFWSILSKYQTFNALFERDFNKAVEKSYFDFSLISLSLYQHNRRKQFIEALNNCSNTVNRYLFHGTQVDPISKIVTDDYKYARKPLFGMGVYFTDLLDYASFYAGGTNYDDRRDNFGRIISVGETISCIATEVFYDIEKKKNIYDNHLTIKELDHFPTLKEIDEKYKDKRVEKQGVHYVRVEAYDGHVKNKEKIEKDRKEGKFMGIEYVITEQDQMLPLYGLTLKRNEYFVIWRDPGFTIENIHSEYLRERRRFIFKQAQMNGFFDSSAERLLEIIKRKKYNKIILLSNCGKDLSGKKFIEVARKILEFDVPVLFFSANKEHFKWIQKFPNAFYTDDPSFYEKYINNYNKDDGLRNLKEEIEKNYNITLKLNNDFLSFPKFIENKEYNDLVFEEICPYFRKVIIKNRQNKKVLFMEKNGEAIFKPSGKINTELFIWYITLINNEITMFSNESYLYYDRKSDTAKYKAMEYFKYEKKDNNYLIYYQNKKNVLTVKGNNVAFEEEKNNSKDQLFEFIDEYHKY